MTKLESTVNGAPPSLSPSPARDVVLAMIVGIGIDAALPMTAARWCVVLVLCVIGATAASLAARRAMIGLAILAMVASLAGLWHHSQFHLFSPHEIGLRAPAWKDSATPACLRGVVVSIPRHRAPQESYVTPLTRDERTTFVLDVEAVRAGDTTDNAGVWDTVSGRLLVTVNGRCEQISRGDRVQCLGLVSQIASPANVGEFDRAAHLRSTERILASLQVPTPESISRESGTPESISRESGTRESGTPSRWRRWVARRGHAEATFRETMSPRGASLASAMLLGFRDSLDDSLRDALVETGTIHLLAISGLHLGLVALAVASLLARCRLRRVVVVVATVALTLVYLAMTDVRPPAIRATTLIVVVAIASLRRGKTISLNTLCISAGVVLAIRPTELFQFGAHLSFLATGVFLWLPSIPHWPNPISPHRFPRAARLAEMVVHTARRITQLFLLTFLVWLIIAPLIASRIHVVTPIAIVVNPLLWLPMVAALLLGLATLVAGLFCPPLAFPLGAAASLCFETLAALITFFHSLPYGCLWLPGLAGWLLLLFYGPLVFWTLFPSWRPSRHTLAGALSVWVVLVVVSGVVQRIERFWSDRLEVTLASVGHGLATVIVAPSGKTVVFDAGCLASPRRAAEVVSTQLWRAGKRRIDTLIVSHPDFDHYSAVPILLERFSIGEVLVSPAMAFKNDVALQRLRDDFRRHGLAVRTVVAGDRLTTLDALFLHPPLAQADSVDAETQSNASSLVLLVRHRGRQVLLTGDFDVAAPPLTQEPLATPLDIVCLPHHGGRSASVEPILAWGQPTTLLVSGGRFLRNDALLTSWKDRGYELYDTLEDGAIAITIGSDGEIQIETYHR